jgi:hypothetical protein
MKMKVDFPHCQHLVAWDGKSQVQTRSEETGLIQHSTLEEAVQHAYKDKTIWKISYMTDMGGHARVVIR